MQQRIARRTVGDASRRAASEQLVSAQLDFERLLADLSGVFANLPPDAVHDEIQRSMERLLVFLDLDRLTFLEVSRSTGRLRLLHSTTTPRGVPAYSDGWEEEFPWWCARLHRGEIVFAEDVSQDLPLEAWKERAYFDSLGIRAVATIPLRVGGKVTAAIGWSDFRSPRRWSKELLARMQMLGEVFANALERKVAAQALSERLEFERLVADLSATFANVASDRVHEEIPRSLERLLSFLGLDRGALLVIRPEDGRLMLLHSVSRAGVNPIVQTDWEEELPTWAQLVHQGQVIAWTNLPDSLPANMRKEKVRVVRMGIRAHLTVPLQVGGKVTGAISVADLTANREWSPEVISRLRMLGEIIANALQRKRTEEALQARLHFESLLADLSATFANLPYDRVQTQIARALERLQDFLQVSRCAMLEVSRRTGRLGPLHISVKDGGSWVASSNWEEDFPWWTQKVHRGEVVVLERIPEDLPPEAYKERSYFESVGLRTALIIPLSVGGRFIGTIGLGDVVSQRKWPAELIARIQMLGEIFANALERRLAEEQVRSSEVLNNAVLASLPGYVAIIDQRGRVFRVNRASRDAGHGPLSNVEVGRDYIDAWSGVEDRRGNGANRVAEIVHSVLYHRRPRAVMEQQYQNGAGERWLEVRVEALDRAEGGAVISHIDITDRKRAEIGARRALDELSHVDRVAAMGELATSLAHELNQPLTAILSNAQAAENFMLPGNMDLNEVRASLSDITENGRRAGEVIRRMRALLKKSEFQPVNLDFNELVGEVAQLVAPGALLRKASVHLDLRSGLPAVRGDPIQLQQVVLNLLLNALDAVAEQPDGARWVRIRTGATAVGSVELGVEDSGPGIPEQHIPRLFEPFFTTKRDGLGMGLSISRSIIDLHGGQIQAENGAAGGAIFRCSLPVLRDFRRGSERR